MDLCQVSKSKKDEDYSVPADFKFKSKKLEKLLDKENATYEDALETRKLLLEEEDSMPKGKYLIIIEEIIKGYEEKILTDKR